MTALATNTTEVLDVDKIFEDAVFLLLDSHEQELFSESSAFFLKAVIQTKRANYDLANYYFLMGEVIICDLEPGSFLNYVVQTAYRPKKALFFSKTKNIKLAKVYTLRALASCKRVEEWGIKIQFFGRMQQYHNLIRLYFKSNLIPSAIYLATECITFLLTEKCLVKDLNSSDISTDCSAFLTLRRLYLYQIFFETLNSIEFMKIAKAERLTYFNSFFGKVYAITRFQNDKFRFKSCIDKYIDVFYSFYIGDFGIFKKDAEKIMDAGNNTITQRIANRTLAKYVQYCYSSVE